MYSKSSFKTSDSGAHFFAGGANGRINSSVMVCNDGLVWVSNTVNGLTESEARTMVRCAKKAGFEAGPKTWWKSGPNYEPNSVVYRKKDADYYDQEIILRKGDTTVEYTIFVYINDQVSSTTHL